MSYEIAFGTPSDIPSILALQESNLPESGGSLSVRQAADWFTRALDEQSLVVARRDSKLVGYVLGTSIATNAHVPVIHTMLKTFPTSSNCYLYGPVCVSEAERGKGLARAMFEKLQSHMRRPGVLFVQADNVASLRAHRKMGMQDLGHFTNEGISFVAFAFAAGAV
jgi:predicted GNAT superfamily acetyltransferase